MKGCWSSIPLDRFGIKNGCFPSRESKWYPTMTPWIRPWLLWHPDAGTLGCKEGTSATGRGAMGEFTV